MQNNQLNRKIFITKDGSSSIRVPELNENYHSEHGAIQESKHIYINNGLNYKIKTLPEINIFEVGFGTGLNAVLTFLEVKNTDIKINYTSIEKYPLTKKEIKDINFVNKLNIDYNTFLKFHDNWDKIVKISDNFNLLKINGDFKTYNFNNKFDIIYFDAFAPNIQPNLWTSEIFNKTENALNKSGIIITYSVKGDVKRILKSLNFTLQQPEGPPGKRNILRAIKN